MRCIFGWHQFYADKLTKDGYLWKCIACDEIEFRDTPYDEQHAQTVKKDVK